mgnify:CR=1 FL=1
MKKFFTTLLVAVGLMSATTASAQVQFGVKAGVNVTNMSLDKEVLDASNRVGFFVGPTVKFTLPVVGLGIDASALYDQREAKVSVDGVQDVVDTEQTLKQRFATALDWALRPASSSSQVRSLASTWATRSRASGMMQPSGS